MPGLYSHSILKKIRKEGVKEGKEGEKKELKEKEKQRDKEVIHLESHPHSTGTCFDLNVLIELNHTVFSLNALAIL